MKLLTHNILTSKMLKGVVTGYPLKLNVAKVEVKKADYQTEFIQRIMQKVNYNALYEAAVAIGHAEGLPQISDYKPELLNEEETLKKLHTALLEVEIIEGELVCPETGRKFPISNGIPNMLVNEDEV
jgi:multifunctional methyltransferase subunit TRM112